MRRYARHRMSPRPPETGQHRHDPYPLRTFTQGVLTRKMWRDFAGRVQNQVSHAGPAASRRKNRQTGDMGISMGRYHQTVPIHAVPGRTGVSTPEVVPPRWFPRGGSPGVVPPGWFPRGGSTTSRRSDKNDLGKLQPAPSTASAHARPTRCQTKARRRPGGGRGGRVGAPHPGGVHPKALACAGRAPLP